jgi:hypothetical protein
MASRALIERLETGSPCEAATLNHMCASGAHEYLRPEKLLLNLY